MSTRTLLVDCGSRRVPALQRAILEQGAELVTMPLSCANAEARETQADILVVSGGPRLFTREPRLIDAFAFLDDFPGPILGICLGHQALGMRHGARVYLGPKRRGSESIAIRRSHPLFAGHGASASFTTSHHEGIDLPAEFVLLADSDAYGVEAMAHATSPWFGVQFHPETSGAPGHLLIANFFALANAT